MTLKQLLAKLMGITRRMKPLNVQTPEFNKPRRAVRKVFIHCSASDGSEHDNIDVIRGWHLDRGWNDVGYHYFIKKNGTIQPGRPIDKVPAAQKGHNMGSIAICLHGLLKANFTERQFDSLRRLCKRINDVYDGEVTFHGHCEISAKDCPVFDYRQVLGLSPSGKML